MIIEDVESSSSLRGSREVVSPSGQQVAATRGDPFKLRRYSRQKRSVIKLLLCHDEVSIMCRKTSCDALAFDINAHLCIVTRR